MYYVNTYSVQAKNNLQKELIAKVEKWKGTLIPSSVLRKDFIEVIRKQVAESNTAFPKCKPCRLRMGEKTLCVDYDGVVDSGFIVVELMKVNSVYGGSISSLSSVI